MCQEGLQWKCSSFSSSWKGTTELQTATFPCPSQMWHVSTATGMCNHITKGVKQKLHLAKKLHRSRWLQTNTCSLTGAKISDDGAIWMLDWTYWINCVCRAAWSDKAQRCYLHLAAQTDKLHQTLRTRRKKGNNPGFNSLFTGLCRNDVLSSEAF